MHIIVVRLKSNDDATLSMIYIDDVFECFGLEDEFRIDKVPGETRIPKGFYQIGLREEGGFHNRYSKKFGEFHKGMLQIMDVENFEYILIHVGNTDDNTSGCLLVGNGAMIGEEITIQASINAYKSLYEKVIHDAKQGMLTIEYFDHD